jgi:hypothetical protein
VLIRVLPTQGAEEAVVGDKVMVARMVLSRSSARKNASPTASTADPVGWPPWTSRLGQRVAAQRPGGELEEREASQQGDGTGGQRGPDDLSEHHGRAMNPLR